MRRVVLIRSNVCEPEKKKKRKRKKTRNKQWRKKTGGYFGGGVGSRKKGGSDRGVVVAFFWQLRDFSNKLFRPFFSHFWLTVTNRGVPFSLKSDQVFFGVETGSRLLSESCQVCLLWWVTVVQHSCEFDCFVSLHLLLNDG